MAGDGAPWYGEFAADAPADFKTWVTNKAFADPQAALLSGFNQEKLMGADRAGRTVILPKDENDADGVKAFRSRIGVPEKPEDYGTPEGLMEGNLWNEAAVAAHKHGLPKAAFMKFVADFFAADLAQKKAKGEKYQADTEAELAKLRGEWGKDFDKNSEFAKRFLKSIGWDDTKIGLFEKTFGTATMLKDFFAFGSKTGEHGFQGGGDDPGAAEALAAVNKQITDLKQRRIENKVDERTYLAEIDRLGKKKTELTTKAA